ncbi:pilin [Psychrilyobacter atlanticus]|uniref:pilin n=1 Tax=Psychrilyobacter atlanticus TaxID=271091 RepID=UPI00041C390A|nr:prepilin-type N-terminal cleavage/methylation domain-containing protein [Psychrilyobacter atlanticus]
MRKIKKGFTALELLIVVAIIGVLAITVVPKIINSLNKAKVAKVAQKLELIRLKLSFEETLAEVFPDLANNDDYLKNKFDVKFTESFSFNDEGHGETDNIVIFRDNKGGWIYNRENGEVYANLPNGAYTSDVDNEIWGGETVPISKIKYSDTLSYGRLQFLNEDGEWEDMIDGETYPADAEIVYLPDSDSISGNTNQVNIGSNTGETVSLSDWGTVNGNTAVLESDGVTITTTVSSGNLATFNGPNSHVGAGIGNASSNGLSSGEKLKIDIDGENINKVIFTLDGLGGYFDVNSRHATKVKISAFDVDGKLIETQSSYRQSGDFLDQYSFEITQPVSYFELTSSGSNGSYVVQNVDLIRSAQDQVNLTIQNPDGTTEVISKDILLDGTNSDDIVTVREKPKEEGEEGDS